MTAPSYLMDHPAMHALYEDLAAALATTPLAPHADRVAFRAVMHASAWLSADRPESDFHATDDQGLILYHKRYRQDGVPALDAHVAALWNGCTLTPAGFALFDDLQDPGRSHPDQHCETGRSHATSLWINHLQLLTTHGLTFEQRLKTAHAAA